MPYKTGSWGEQSKERSKKRTAYFVKYRKKFAEKKKARQVIDYLLMKGALKAEECKIGILCHGRIEAHHPDYSKPLEVIWFCSKHHREEHNRIKKMTTGILYCRSCSKRIYPPRKKYCSSTCNLKGWRKGT